MNVIFYELPEAPSAGDDKIYPFLFKTTLEAQAPAVGQAHWQTVTKQVVFDDSINPQATVSNLPFGKTSFSWVVRNGACKVVADSMVVDVTDLSVPEGFSPNNDHVNDLFQIYGLENVKDARLSVFNQWGVEVYKNNDYKSDWDGTYKGTLLPDGTYFYVLNVIGRTYKGFVVVKQ